MKIRRNTAPGFIRLAPIFQYNVYIGTIYVVSAFGSLKWLFQLACCFQKGFIMYLGGYKPLIDVLKKFSLTAKCYAYVCQIFLHILLSSY